MIMTALILLVALSILGWGFYRSRPYGKLGLLSWLQSVVVMVPWLLFFGLFAVGIYLNLAGVLLILVISTGGYIYLGRLLRAVNQESAIAPSSKSEGDRAAVDSNSNSNPESKVEAASEAKTPPTDLTVTPIPAEDLQAIQGIFGIDTYFCTETIPYQEGAIFKGNLRHDPQMVHAQLTQSLKERVGDRYRLFLVQGSEEKPVVIVLPSRNDPQPATVPQRIFAAILFLATCATCLETAGILQGFDVFSAYQRIPEALPIALGILAILIAHELGHRVMARQHQVRLSPPFFLPTWQIGSLGSFFRFESILPNRRVLFDIAFAGPAVGGLLALVVLLIGLVLSPSGGIFQLPSEFFQGSILVGMLARIVLGDALQQPLISIHPLAIVGWIGLVVTAINLMPAGQLDGGRIVQSIYGRKVARWGTVATLVVLAIASLVNSLALYWAIVIFFLQRDLERPSLEEISEPDDARAALGLLALFLMAATLLPVTPSLAGRLGIGG
jgi:membrane-associated protease RseP (regulator of RpoE activity)